LHFKKLECPSEKAFHFQNAAQSLDEKKRKKVYISNNHFQNVAQAMEEKNMLGNMLSNYTKKNHCRSLNVYFTPKINFFDKCPC